MVYIVYTFVKGSNGVLHDSWGQGATGHPVAFVYGDEQHVFARGTGGTLEHWWWEPGGGIRRAGTGTPRRTWSRTTIGASRLARRGTPRTTRRRTAGFRAGPANQKIATRSRAALSPSRSPGAPVGLPTLASASPPRSLPNPAQRAPGGLVPGQRGLPGRALRADGRDATRAAGQAAHRLSSGMGGAHAGVARRLPASCRSAGGLRQNGARSAPRPASCGARARSAASRNLRLAGAKPARSGPQGDHHSASSAPRPSSARRACPRHAPPAHAVGSRPLGRAFRREVRRFLPQAGARSRPFRIAGASGWTRAGTACSRGWAIACSGWTRSW